MGTHRRLGTIAVLLGLGVLGSGLQGCSFGGDDTPPGPDPQPVADALATGLQSGKLGQVDFGGTPGATVTKDYASITDGLGVDPTVEVDSIDRPSDTTATAHLSWSWPLTDDGWSYGSDAAMELDGSTWTVTWDPSLVEPSLGDAVTLDATTLTATRAPILGAGGVGLVMDRPVVKIGIDRTKVKPAQVVASAQELARLIDIDVASYVKQVKASGPSAFIQGIVYRKDDVPPKVLAGVGDIKGGAAIADTLPLGPSRTWAAPILGTVGPVTAEMIKDHPDLYRVGDEAGLSGLEARYDEQLRGKPGVRVDAVGSDGKRRKLFQEKPANGTPLKLTLDYEMQSEAEQLLSGIGPASALVAIRPSTGAILAIANGPGTDGYNIATYGRFAPGSTFKTVGSLALLRHGVTASSPVECPTRVVVDGKEFTNDSFYPPAFNGRITLAQALANSCNTAYINERTKLGSHDLVDAAATLGMGVDHDTGFPSYFGNVVPPTSETEKAADMIGQGAILASPMTMATVMSSVVAGHTVVPQLIRTLPPEKSEAEALTASQASTLRQMLRGVVLGGTGQGLRDVPGAPVIAKTGTAEFDRGGKRLTHAWMIAGQGDLAVCVLVDVGETGAGTAGPVVEAFLRSVR